MKINWKVRVKNPVFWIEVAAAIVLPIFAYFGLNWEDMTTWGALGRLFLDAVKNPVVVASVLISVGNAIIDPTTKGLTDSARAMTYTEPGK